MSRLGKHLHKGRFFLQLVNMIVTFKAFVPLSQDVDALQMSFSNVKGCLMLLSTYDYYTRIFYSSFDID